MIFSVKIPPKFPKLGVLGCYSDILPFLKEGIFGIVPAVLTGGRYAHNSGPCGLEQAIRAHHTLEKRIAKRGLSMPALNGWAFRARSVTIS